jgi:microcystin-dependent protein
MESYLGEIRMFAGAFAPDGWLLCNGALLDISQYQALFSLISTTYGGNGATNFNLPDLRGRIPIGQGQGPGLANYTIGQTGGTETVTLTVDQIPAHTHIAYAYSDASALPNATSDTPATNNLLARTDDNTGFYINKVPPSGAIVALKSESVTQAGGSISGTNAHPNMMPSFCVNFIISVSGIYPDRP